ncbi:MAG: hypothetical protein KGI25_09800 [Thaumarchaeota archaeon]|nr:hypothetical protein [Nitrososphaerota archaeon]
MATLSFCATPPLPTFNSLYQSVQPLLLGPFPVPSFPPLPTLPSPMFIGLHIPNIEAVQFASELQCSQILNLILDMFKPVVSFLGLALNDILPKIPFLGINLIQLLEGDANVFIAQLEGIAANVILGISSLPSQLYNNYIIPALSNLQKYQLLIRSYFASLINVLFGLVNQVAHILSVGALTLPTIPDFGEFFNGYVFSILSQFIVTVDGILVLPVEISVVIALVGAALTAGLGLAFDTILPEPLLPSLNLPEYTLLEQLKNLYTNFSVSPLQILLDFIVNTLQLSVTIPKICIGISIPDVAIPPLVVPGFSLPNIPSIPSIPDISGNLNLTIKLPSISLPSISLPSISLPSATSISGVSVSLPSVSLPSVSLPTISAPSLNLSAQVSLPTFNLPNISIPTFKFPHLPFPMFSIPSFTVPSISIPKLPSIPSINVPNLKLNVAISANINVKI